MCEQSPATPLTPVVYTLDVGAGTFRRHDPAQPVVFWDDAAVTRGEAVFESVLVRAGRAANLQRHLARLQRSAQRLELPVPERELWARATTVAVTDWQQHLAEAGQRAGALADASGVDIGGVDAKCTWTYSRGRQSVAAPGMQPTAWLVIAPVTESVLRQRREGVRAQLVPRGWTTTVGAKTVNYAATMSALRQARGFDDVIFVEPAIGSSEREARVLEGATSTVVLVLRDDGVGKRRLVTPAGDVLAGTTVDALFEYAAARGWRCENRPVTAGELYQAESVWLISSVRIAARVTSLGGLEATGGDADVVELPAPENHAEIRALIEQALSL
ncbi:aminodeoxychorismate lyase [Corynebacterium propinquum]|uniref:aminodeoxychorismate lyase n=1 Tax=Corynebacterium propinquum TaxID=43769 RepID=UPI00164E6BBA|nr:aminodeoxychorismate lyase [Corynebacterium propinquum]MDK4252525.1 aminodeoxychorismate lyase [Corynebacterium propinquum]MDK4257951.1 aminodeoxychorismate lyase [Corynebacterium propinquum]MDK4282018.1 aminodeoxychorismate lyase [Corynebacterium propinquum]MDK4297950.1 aminodeoxychorismate lyase [Corynebacterium propinquum]MDK4319778.1 aminodeoxychorismate lyase [Corynebacterium propinquum]